MAEAVLPVMFADDQLEALFTLLSPATISKDDIRKVLGDLLGDYVQKVLLQRHQAAKGSQKAALLGLLPPMEALESKLAALDADTEANVLMSLPGSSLGDRANVTRLNDFKIELGNYIVAVRYQLASMNLRKPGRPPQTDLELIVGDLARCYVTWTGRQATFRRKPETSERGMHNQTTAHSGAARFVETCFEALKTATVMPVGSDAAKSVFDYVALDESAPQFQADNAVNALDRLLRRKKPQRTVRTVDLTG